MFRIPNPITATKEEEKKSPQHWYDTETDDEGDPHDELEKALAKHGKADMWIPARCSTVGCESLTNNEGDKWCLKCFSALSANKAPEHATVSQCDTCQVQLDPNPTTPTSYNCCGGDSCPHRICYTCAIKRGDSPPYCNSCWSDIKVACTGCSKLTELAPRTCVSCVRVMCGQCIYDDCNICVHCLAKAVNTLVPRFQTAKDAWFITIRVPVSVLHRKTARDAQAQAQPQAQQEQNKKLHPPPPPLLLPATEEGWIVCEKEQSAAVVVPNALQTDLVRCPFTLPQFTKNG